MSRALILAIVPCVLTLTIGCTADPDGDGLTNKEEADLGTDPDLADSDGDGIDDPTEIADGLDPLSADSDGDGLDDLAELDNGSDPLNRFSWPGDGVWPDMSADYPGSETYGMGEVFPDMRGKDKNREDLYLSQFYGHVILLDFSAGWCGPCNVVAETAEEEWVEHREDGYVIIHAMVDGWGNGPANNQFVNEWIEEYGLTFPVMGNGTIDGATDGLWDAGLNQGYIPYLILLDSEMRIDRIYEGSGNETQIRRRVERLLEDVEP